MEITHNVRKIIPAVLVGLALTATACGNTQSNPMSDSVASGAKSVEAGVQNYLAPPLAHLDRIPLVAKAAQR